MSRPATVPLTPPHRRDAAAPTRYERLLATAGAHAYARASAAARGGVAAPTRRLRTIRDVAAGVAGPLLYSYVRWVGGQARRAGVRRLYFVARDGQLLLRVARACPDLTGGCELRYLHGSRHVWYLAGADPERLPAQPWLTEDASTLTPALLLARFGLPAGEVAALLGPGDVPDRPLGEDGLREAVSRLGRPAAAARVAAAVAERRALVHRYLAGQGLFDGTLSAIVDLGWAGRMYAALAAVVRAGGQPMPQVYLLGLQRIVEVRFPCAAWLFDVGTPGEVPVRRVAAAVEAFCLSAEGHVAGYADGAGGVRPVLHDTTGAASRRWGVATLQDTVAAVAGQLGADPHPPLDRATAVELLRAFWCRPTRAEAAAWSSCPYEVDQQARLPARLARPLTHAEALRRARAGVDPWAGQAWPDGARRLTPPAARLVLALAGRRRPPAPRSL